MRLADERAATPVTVRPARPDEYARIGELTEAVYVGGGLIDPGDDYVETLRDAAGRAAAAELLVAEAGGALVGSVAYCPHGGPYSELAAPGEAEFRMLAVLPAARGAGAGGALVRACLDRARAAGLTGVRLSTQPNMTDAHRLYERLGFVRTPGRDWTPVPDVLLWTYHLPL
ncbi:GNAT family N-acetyltransferase [Actinomadura atramentaria]|uniref:GNAT family N-acetyltransferase n=1 Tax=Actinomadura atramentaria TaxID=1990 RepID=UPI000367DAF8|nr:GNAT family N-acetyltransferase [Actinomadura atramentaria]